MKRIINFLLFIIVSVVYSQESKQEFGIITTSEINLKVCPFDSTARAVVLFDIGVSKFESDGDNFNIRFKKHKRIKIFKDSNEDYSEIYIPLYNNQKGSKEKVRNLKAITYNFEGNQVVKNELDKKTVYEEKINDNWFQKKFVFPNVKSGSIIEYEYEIVSPFKFNLVDWEFQSELPTLYSEYKVFMVPFYEYVSSAQQIKKFDIQTSIVGKRNNRDFGILYKDYIHTYALKNIEAFKDENYITTKNDYLKKIKFQLSKIIQPDKKEEIISTWDKLREELLSSDYFGKYIKSSKRIAKKILEEEIDLSDLDESQKIIKLVNYTKDNFHWNGKYRRNSYEKTAKEFYKTKDGNSASINLFLIALLNEAGISAQPLIISTRDHGKINLNYPFISAFNYVLVYIKGKITVITDATSSQLSYDTIPTYCINDYGLLVNESKEGEWMEIEYTKPSIELIDVEINVDIENQQTNSIIKQAANSFKAQEFRTKFLDDSLKIKKHYTEFFDKVTQVKTENYSNTLKSYQISFKGSKEVEKIGDFLIIHPYKGLSIKENLLKEEKRSYPVDFIYPLQKQFRININIPEGYKLDKLPKSNSFENELISLRTYYKLNTDTNRLKIASSYFFKKSVYAPNEYTQLVKNIDQIVEEFNKEIYLKEN